MPPPTGVSPPRPHRRPRLARFGACAAALGLVWPLGLHLFEFEHLPMTFGTVLGFVAASTATAFIVRRTIVVGSRFRAATRGAALGLVVGAPLVGAWIPLAAWLRGTTWDGLSRLPFQNLPGDVLFVAVMSLLGCVIFAPVVFPLASLVCLLLRAVHGVPPLPAQAGPTPCASGRDRLFSESTEREEAAPGA